MPSITLAMSTVIAAPRHVVWRALAEPERALAWRPGAVSVLSPPAESLRPGRIVRIRCRIAGLPIVLEDVAIEVVREERLRSGLRLGLFRCEETFTLAAADPDGGHTRLGVRLSAPSETPLVGESLDRFGVRRFAAELSSGALAALRRSCECASRAPQRESAWGEPKVREVV